MTYTLEQIAAHEAKACPSCHRRVEQQWVDVSFRRLEYVPGRWICHTPGCEHGPPTQPDGCTCQPVDASTLGEAGSRWALAGDPRCTAHGAAA